MTSAKDKFRKIHLRMWGDAAVRALSRPQPNGQSLWVHLLAGSQTGIVPGLIASTEMGMAGALKWELEAFRKAFREVSGDGDRKVLAEADWDAGLVWVPNGIKYNSPQSPNVIIGWKQAWDELPECLLKAKAYLRLRTHVEAIGKGFAKAFEEHVASPSGSSWEALANQEQEQEQEKEEDTSTSSPVTVVRPKAREAAPSDPVFSHWATAMGKDPARTKLNAARKAKLKARRAEGYTDEQLCQAVDGCKLSPFHMGTNDRGELYNDLTVILRDGATVEKHIERAAPKPAVARVHYLGGMP